MIQEVDYKLGVDSEGVIVSEPKETIAVRVAEWLDTPRGQMWGAPQWGHVLTQYKHEPMNSTTEAAIENSILLHLPVDVQGVIISNIEVSATQFDLYHIEIKLNNNVKISKEVAL